MLNSAISLPRLLKRKRSCKSRPNLTRINTVDKADDQ